MRQKKWPSLRYFAKFRGDFGYLRAIARNGEIRKSIVTPLVITREQLSRLNSLGHLDPMAPTIEDVRLEGRLREYTATAWEVINTLIASGEFATFPSEKISTAIMQLNKAKEEERAKKSLTRLGYDVDTMQPEVLKPGFHYADGKPMGKADEKQVRAILAEISKEGETDAKQ